MASGLWQHHGSGAIQPFRFSEVVGLGLNVERAADVKTCRVPVPITSPPSHPPLRERPGLQYAWYLPAHRSSPGSPRCNRAPRSYGAALPRLVLRCHRTAVLVSHDASSWRVYVCSLRAICQR